MHHRPLTPPDPALRQLATIYLATEVLVTLDGKLLPAAIAVTRLGAPLHVITAWNPGAERPGLALNRAANTRLLADLRAGGVSVWPAVGRDPQGSHAEESWAVIGLPLPVVCELGRHYAQVAVFEIVPGMQRVVACDGSWSVERAL